MAFIARCVSCDAVINRRGTSGNSDLERCNTSVPVAPGIISSTSTAAGLAFSRNFIASVPSRAACTRKSR
jgi:hypothetical protein